jgi:hypothetical protein
VISIAEIVRRLSGNAEAVAALMQTVSDEQAQWKPDRETWSLNQVMEHLYDEERMDFRSHLEEMLSDPPQPWGARREEHVPTASCRQALAGFVVEREASIAWLMALQTPDWDTVSEARFGPSDVLLLSAGDVLVSWVAHDFLHIRQMNELLYAWNEKQAAPYSVQYAGGW